MSVRTAEVKVDELIPGKLYRVYCPVCLRFLILHHKPKIDRPLVCYHSDRPELDWRLKLGEKPPLTIHPVCRSCKKSCKQPWSFWSGQLPPWEYCPDYCPKNPKGLEKEVVEDEG